jgi:hypothetical protein
METITWITWFYSNKMVDIMLVVEETKYTDWSQMEWAYCGSR